jgi:predicted short-subunit dehydrogenase-like oxidoreductase (DUF2520 family)
MSLQNISFAGSGRVASSLCKKISEAGFKIDLIVSPSEENGRMLAEVCKSLWSSELKYPQSTDLIIVAVPDHRLKNVLDNLRCSPETLIVHTAGSIGIDIFPARFNHKGVFYPLQTFSKERKVDFTGLPFLLETSDMNASAILEELVKAVGGKGYFVNSDQRIMLHLAAVFICNFTNHMLTGGKRIADKTGVTFDIFYPLLRETISKAMEIGPEKSQTGPAVRNDHNTIEKHLELLSFSPELKEIYREITTSIMKFHNKS